MTHSQKYEVFQDDVGTLFELTVVNPKDGRPINISDATDLKIIFQVPPATLEDDFSRMEKDASFVSDGSDGRIKYVTIAGDLAIPGSWRLQARVTTPDGSWSSQIVRFKVESNL